MEMPPPPELDVDQLLLVVRDRWTIDGDAMRYQPKGIGAYHWTVEVAGVPSYFVTVDDLTTKPWIAPDADATFVGLTAAYETAAAVHSSTGIDLVVPPLCDRDGRVTVRICDRFSLAVFPFVAGESGEWGQGIAPEARITLLTGLARLHLASPPDGVPIPIHRFEMPERAVLLDALADLGRRWTGGPYSDPAQRLLAKHAGTIRARLDTFDRMAISVNEHSSGSVVTHGEPHPGNVMHSDGGIRLVDWDTVALAPAERDLWMLDDGSADAFAVYAAMTGRPVSRDAIEFFGLQWTLSDIASFTEVFRGPHVESNWLAEKWTGFAGLVEGATSTPYDWS